MIPNNKQLLHEILSLSKQFIAIVSIRDNPEALHSMLELVNKACASKFTIEKFEENGVVSCLIHNAKKGTKHFKVILNAHLDVVPGQKEQFVPFEKNGKLYGRGSYDMKAAAAVMLILFKHIGKDIPYPFALQVVTDEENYSKHTTQYQIKKGIRADFVICGESSSNLEIVHKAKGGLWIILKARGKTAHGGYPWRGKNALWKLHDVLYKIKKLYPIPTKEEWVTTVNLAKITTGNEAFNAVPEEAVAHLDVRFIHEDKTTIIEKLQKIIPEDIEMEVLQNTSPTFVSEHNAFVKLLQEEAQKVTKKATKIKVAHATSDIRFYNEVGCVGVEFGPRGKNQHSDNEYVMIKSLGDYYHILKNFLLSANNL